MDGGETNKRAEWIFNQAVEICGAAERAAFVRGACGEDTKLLSEALDIHAQAPVLWRIRAKMFESGGELEKALEAFDEGVKLADAHGKQEVLNSLLLDRSIVLRKLKRARESALDFCRAKGIPARDTPASRQLIDLSEYFNSALMEDWRQGKEVLLTPRLAPGVRQFNGTQSDVRGAVQLSGKPLKEKNPTFPDKVSGIRVGQSCQRLHFLHSTVWDEKSQTLIGKYIIHFQDGGVAEQPILYGQHVRDFYSDKEPFKPSDQARIAWEAQSENFGKRRIFELVWENPKPDAVIDSIDFVSAMTDCAPFLLAITVE